MYVCKLEYVVGLCKFSRLNLEHPVHLDTINWICEHSAVCLCIGVQTLRSLGLLKAVIITTQ